MPPINDGVVCSVWVISHKGGGNIFPLEIPLTLNFYIATKTGNLLPLLIFTFYNSSNFHQYLAKSIE